MENDAFAHSADREDEPLVSFMETIEHVGGAPVIVGGVLLLLVAYLFLVEWLLPRRRHQISAKQQRQRTATRKVQ